MKKPILSSALLCLLAALFAGQKLQAQTPPAEFYTNLVNGGTTLNMYFKQHSVRGANFAVFVQTGASTFTNFTFDAPRTYLGYATNRSDVFACATLLPDGKIWATCVFPSGVTWYYQSGNNSSPGTRGSASYAANWPTAPTVGTGGAGTNIYAADTGWDLRWTYLNSCGGDINTAVRHAEHSTLSANLIYLQEAGLFHRLDRVVVRANRSVDPYETSSSLLNDVRSQWQSVLPGPTGRGYPDVWGLVSPGFGGGVAWVSAACTSSGCSVDGLNGLDWDVVWRHEVGHNWSLGHYDGGTPEGATINSGNSLARMSSCELYRVISYRNSKLGSLNNLGSYSFQIPPNAALDLGTVSSIGSVALDVLNNDHDANGQKISIQSFATTSSTFGATITRSVGTGPGGRDQLIYTANPAGGFGVDRFTYTAVDSFGLTAQGNVYVKVTPPDSDVVAHWPLDETSGTAAKDVSGSLRHGTVSTSTAWTDGVLGGALNFDGTATQVALPAFNLNTNTMTVTAWIKRNGTQSSMSGLLYSRAGATISGFHFGTANELRYTWNSAYATYNWNSGLVPPDGQWTFIALVVDAAKAVIYMDDGTGLKSATNFVANANQDFASTTYLGQDPMGGRFYKGVMDDVHVFRRALSLGEILQFAGGGGTAYSPSPGLGDSLVDESAVLRWQNPRYSHGQQIYIGTDFNAVRTATTASPEFQGTFEGSQYLATLPTAGLYFWRVDELYNGVPLAGPVWFFNFTPVIPSAEWRLNEIAGTTAYDSVGGLNGIFYNSPTLNQPGVLIQPTNRAVTFNGSNQKVDVPYNPILAETPLTIEVWCKVTGGAGTYRSPATCRDDNPQRGWTFYASSGNTWQFWYGDGTTNGWKQLTGPAVVNNQWVHLVAVIDENDQSFYVNGVLAGLASVAYAPNTARPLRIGAGSTEGSGGVWFPGSVDQVSLYNYPMSAEEVAGHYAAQANQVPAFAFTPFTASPATPAAAYADSIAGNATDPNAGDTLTFSKISGPAWLTVGADGTLSGTPGTGDVGLNSFSVRVTDFGGLTDTATLLVPVGATVWNGAGGDSQWNSAANWTGTAPTNEQALVFQGLARRLNTNNFLTTAGPIGLNNAGFAINGNPLNLAGGIASYGLNVWNVPGTLVAPQTFWSSLALLTVGGPLSLNGQTLTVDGTDDVLFAGPMSGAGNIIKQGAGNMIVSGTNSLTATVRVNAGTLQIGNGGNGGDIGSAAVTNNGTVKFNRANSFTFPNVISGSGAVAQIGGGTVTLTGANTYTGTTTLSTGTLAVSGGKDRLPANTTVVFPANATLNVANTTTQTVAKLSVNNGLAPSVTGGGQLNIAPGQDFTVGSTVSSTTTLNLAGLNSFVFNDASKNVNIGGQTSGGTTAAGTLTLAANSAITANNLNVQTVGSVTSYVQSTANTGTLNLGKTNALNVNTLNLATSGSDHGYLQFASAVINPLVTIRNAAGTGRATINIGGHGTVGGPSATTAKFDLSSNATGSVLDALVSTLTIGICGRIGSGTSGSSSLTENASFAMGGGTLDATSVVLGSMANNAGNFGTLNSTFTVSGGTVKVFTLTLGNHTDANGALNSTFNLNSGATLAAQTIALGTGNATRTFNWNSGTIRNYDAATSLTTPGGLTLATTAGGTHDLTIDAGRTGTINSVIAGNAAITKSGTGLATFTAANTYTDATTINAGTLALDSAGSLSASPVITVASGATFDVSAVSGFTINAAQTLQGNGLVRGNTIVAGTLSPGGLIGTLIFYNNLILTGTTAMEIVRTNGLAANDQAVVVGTVTYGGALIVTNIGSSALQAGDTFKLFSAGARSGSFSSVVLPPLTAPLYWKTNLTLDGTLVVTSPVNPTPTNLVATVSGANLNLSWPADHTGWRLETQTNTLGAGLGTNWFNWMGSDQTNAVVIPINPANPTVFFRLIYP